ncbi:MAG: hypothetical protein R2792_20125 [Saprospiraceae bacterium]
MKVHFKESQKFTQLWILVPIILAGLIPLFGLYKQLVLGGSFGNKPMSNTGLVIFLLFELALLLLFWKMRLDTEIDERGIRVRFFPFVNKHIDWRSIKKAEMINYGFVGGWGIRLGTKHGTVYNISGNKGLAIELEDGKKICIGTQKEMEMEEVLKELGRE